VTYRLRGSDKLAAIAAVSYTVQRYLVDAFGGRAVVEVVDAFGNSILAGILISIVGSFGVLYSDLALLTQVSLYTVGLYVVLPELISTERTELIDIPIVRLGIALWSGVIGLLVASSPPTMAVFVLLITVSPATYGLIFWQIGSHENGRNRYVVAAWELAQADQSDILEDYNPDSYGSILLNTYAAGLILVLISFVLGALLTIFIFVYPLVEIALIGIWFIGLINRYSQTDWFDDPRERMEQDFFALARHAPAYPLISAGAFGIFVGGITASAFPVFAVFAIIVTGGLDLLTTLLSIRGIVIAGILVGGFVYGVYGLLYWRQVVRRFSSMLQSRAGNAVSASVRRYPGEMIVPSSTVVLFSTLTLAQGLVLHHTGTDTAPIWVVVIIGCILLSWPVIAIRRYGMFPRQADNPQPLDSDVGAVPKAWAIQVVGLVIGIWLGSGYSAVKTGGLDTLAAKLVSEATGMLKILLFVPGLIGLFWLDRLTTGLPDRILTVKPEIIVGALLSAYIICVAIVNSVF
jgi:hypothetical protein